MSDALGVQHALRPSSTYMTGTKSRMWRYRHLKIPEVTKSWRKKDSTGRFSNRRIEAGLRNADLTVRLGDMG
jgi:hypothetical protein